MVDRRRKLVSVIIPTRNRKDLVAQAVRSALSQTWSDIEIFVIDDGSTDSTASMISEWFPSVRLIASERPRGPSAARNAGIDVSTGDYLLFLDDDDLLHPGHVSALMGEVDRVCHGTPVSGRWRSFQLTNGQVHFGPVMRAPEQFAETATLAELIDPLGDCRIWTASVLWPRCVFDSVRWDEELFTNGDVDFFGRAVLAGARIVGRPVGMAYYRMHAGERVAGTQSERALISSTRYRLKWCELCSDRADRAQLGTAIRNGLMSLMIGWSQANRGSTWLPALEKTFRDWGGKAYFLPTPPRNRLKRLIAAGVLRVGGPMALGWLLNLKSRKPDQASSRTIPAAGNDDIEDERVINSLA